MAIRRANAKSLSDTVSLTRNGWKYEAEIVKRENKIYTGKQAEKSYNGYITQGEKLVRLWVGPETSFRNIGDFREGVETLIPVDLLTMLVSMVNDINFSEISTEDQQVTEIVDAMNLRMDYSEMVRVSGNGPEAEAEQEAFRKAVRLLIELGYL